MSFKKKSWIIVFLMLVFNSLFIPYSLASDRQGTFELTIGSYSMSETRFREVYQSGGVIEGIGLSVFIINDFDFYFEMKGFYKSGELTHTKEKTEFLLIPISLGFRYKRPIGLFYPYVGLGIDYYFYLETNPIQSIVNYTKGFHVRIGSYIQFAEQVPIWLNFRLKYTNAKTEENDLEIQLGGFEYGLGLVFVF